MERLTDKKMRYESARKDEKHPKLRHRLAFHTGTFYACMQSFAKLVL